MANLFYKLPNLLVLRFELKYQTDRKNVIFYTRQIYFLSRQMIYNVLQILISDRLIEQASEIGFLPEFVRMHTS